MKASRKIDFTSTRYKVNDVASPSGQMAEKLVLMTEMPFREHCNL